jgi:hypothetical protein
MALPRVLGEAHMIELRYKCGCMSEETTLMVRERRAHEDIIRWMDFVVRPALGIDHQKRSPLCRADKVEYLKVPVEDEKPIGSGKTRY